MKDAACSRQCNMKQRHDEGANGKKAKNVDEKVMDNLIYVDNFCVPNLIVQ